MFQTTRRRLALWYTTVTAVLLLLFASGFYLYVRSTLVERIDDTLNHVVEVVQRSLVIEPLEPASDTLSRVNLEASFRNNAEVVEDDHIDLEWFSPVGEMLWSTFSQPVNIPLHVSNGETVYVKEEGRGKPKGGEDLLSVLHPSSLPSFLALRQVTQRIEIGRQVVGYLRVSHPWFEVTKPSRQLILDLSLGTALMVGVVAAIGWLLSGLAIAPVRDSYQRLKQFTADASHELRNPIAVIQTNVQVALSDPEPDPQLQQQQLEVVERLTRRLGQLVDDLLFLARQDSSMAPMRVSVMSLDQLLLQVIEEQRAIATEKEITLLFTTNHPENLTPHAYPIQGDRDQLIRLFTNLISNALQYTPAAGQVHVLLQWFKSHGSSHLQVLIKDTGIGIPEEAIPHIFDRFYRADPARSRDGLSEVANGKAGSGLGLAIAKVIVENHHGQIHVESTLGQGTIFTVTLPNIVSG
jgi:OmpR-family two-component system manganese-sensing sensor histidine kinase